MATLVDDWGESPIRQVVQERVGIPQDAAQHRSLLSATDRTPADIGREIGYTESSSFIRFFRKFEGVTPGQYRERVS